MSDDVYKSGHHLPRVKHASGVRLGAWLVLAALCDRSSYKKPEVTITKAQISKITGLERKAVQRGLAKLRSKGVIEPIKGFAGGAGVATTYRLVVIGQGGELQPQEDAGEGIFPSFEKWQDQQGGIKRSYSDYLADRKRSSK